MLCAALGFAAWLVQEILYRDILQKALSHGQTLELVRFYKALRLKEPKALNFWSSESHYACIFG
jgi:hypothetical protein